MMGGEKRGRTGPQNNKKVFFIHFEDYPCSMHLYRMFEEISQPNRVLCPQSLDSSWPILCAKKRNHSQVCRSLNLPSGCLGSSRAVLRLFPSILFLWFLWLCRRSSIHCVWFCYKTEFLWNLRPHSNCQQLRLGVFLNLEFRQRKCDLEKI